MASSIGADVLAEPEVLYDSGNTIVLPDHSTLRKQLGKFGHSLDGEIATEAVKTEPAGLRVPFVVSGISLGKFDAYQHKLSGVTKPICVIGSDRSSLAWLIRFYDILKTNSTTCLLVEAASSEALIQVKQYARELPVVPDVNNAATRILKLKHYPALITQNWVEQ